MNKELLKDQQALDEFFTVPVGLKEVDDLYGFKVYSSDRLVKAYLNSIKKSGRGNPVYEQIKKLVEQKKVMPIFQVKGILRFLAHKMFGNPEDKIILGFYHMGIKRVYIMIDNSVSVFGTARDDDLASTTIHECQHLFANTNKSKFLSIYNEPIYRYYVSAFSRMFQLRTIPKRQISNIVHFITSIEGVPFNKIKGKIDKNYISLLTALKPYSNLPDNEFRRTVNDFLLVIRLFIERFDLFVKSYRKHINILGPLDKAYKDAFSKANLYTVSYQELISISEVICVLSEIKPSDPKIKQGFKSFS